MRVPAANPPERSRVNAVNSRIKSAAGEVRLMVNLVRAPHVVTDLEGVALLSTTAGTFRSELIFAHQINELAKSARPCLAA
jgi:glutamine amidotransferase PdxT